MPFPTALKVLGPALTATAEGFQKVPELIDKDEELQARHDLRPITLEEAKLRLQKTREGIHPTHFTTHGIYEWNPAEGRYTYTQSEEQKKQSAKEAEMGAIVAYGAYPPGTPQRNLYDAYLSKMNAPGVTAAARERLVDPTITKWQAQAAHWKQLEEQARTKNSVTAGHYAQQNAYWNKLIGLRQQALDQDPSELKIVDGIAERLQSGDPGQVAAAQQWLDRKGVGVAREQRLAEREPAVQENLEARTQDIQTRPGERQADRESRERIAGANRTSREKVAAAKTALQQAKDANDVKKMMQQQIAADPSLLDDPEYRTVADALKVTADAMRVVPSDANIVPRSGATRQTLGGQPQAAARPPGIGVVSTAAKAGYIRQFTGMPIDEAMKVIDMLPMDSFRRNAAEEAFGEVFDPTKQGKTGASVVATPPVTTAPTPPTTPAVTPAVTPATAPGAAAGVPGTIHIPPSPRQEDIRADQKETLRQTKLTHARVYKDELDALEHSERLAKMVASLVQPATVGMRGKVQRFAQSILAPNAGRQELELTLRRMDPNAEKTIEDARQKTIAMVTTEGLPMLNNVGIFNPKAPMLDVLSSALAYVHALNLKRQGSSSGRGVNKSDVEAAHELFNPNAWLSSTNNLLAGLIGLQAFIQSTKPTLQRRIDEIMNTPGTAGTPAVPAAVDPNALIDKALAP